MKLLKWIYAAVLLLFTCKNAAAQNSTASTDSSTRQYELQEVTVCEHLNPEEAENSFYRNSKSATVEDILVRMQGVSLIRRGNYGMEPMLRGYSAGQINLTLDGMKIVGACTDKMDPVSIYVEPVNLQSLQVQTGAQTAQNGSALGGGINMMLKEPEFMCDNKPYAGFNTGYATANKGITESFFLNLNSNVLAWRLSGAYRKAENYITGGGTTVPFSGYEKANLSTALLWQANKAHTFKIDYLEDRGWNIGFPALTMDVGYARASIASVTHKYSGKRFLSIRSKLYHNRVTHHMDDTRRPAIPMHMDMPGWSRTSGWFTEINLKAIKRHQLFARLDATHSFTSADMVMYPTNEPAMFMQTLPDNYRINTGIFLSDRIQIDSLNMVSLSGRADRMLTTMNSDMGIKQWAVFGNFPLTRVLFTGNIQVSWTRILSLRSVLSATGGYAERAPTPNELYGYYLFNRLDNFDYTGNMMLKKEKALQAEASYTLSTKHIRVQSVVYYHHITNYILGITQPLWIPMTIGARGVKAITNLPYGRIYGADLNLSYSFKPQLEHITTAKLTIGSDHLNNPLPQIPPLKVVHAFKWKVKKWFFQPEAEWALAQHRNNAAFGEMQTRSYLLTHLRMGYKINTGHHIVQFSASVENITDQKYREHLDFTSITRAGRNFIFNLNYTFH